MNIIIRINCDNAAFEVCDENDEPMPGVASGVEIARILSRLADRPEADNMERGESMKLRDHNGNFVGEIRATKR